MKRPTLFSKWMRKHLKDAYSGLITSDIDFIITREDRKYFIVEEKNKIGARTGPAQAIIYKMLDQILSNDSEFLGCHKVTVSNDNVNVNELKTIDLHDFLKTPKKYYLNEYNQSWFEKVLYFNLKYLWDGKGTPPTKKTERERTFKRESLLKPLLEKKNISFESIDWIFINYVTGNYILLSESNNKLGVSGIKIDDLFNRNKNGEFGVKNPKSECTYKYLGHYSITYSSNSEGDITSFFINSIEISVDEAINVFNLDNRNIEKFNK